MGKEIDVVLNTILKVNNGKTKYMFSGLKSEANSVNNNLKSSYNSINKINSSLKQTTSIAKNVNKSSSALNASFGKIAGIASTALGAAGIVKFGSDCVNSFSDAQSSAAKFYATLAGSGYNIDKADNFISNYIKDGIVTINDAQVAYANLAAMGMNTDQIESILNTFKDSASVARQSGKTVGEAIAQSTEGLKLGMSINLDNAGITTNISTMEENYKRLNNITGELTNSQKNLAYQMAITAEGAKYAGSATKMTNTYVGSVNRLSTTLSLLKTNIGSIIGTVITPVISWLNVLLVKLNAIASSVSVVVSKFFNIKSVKDIYSGISTSASSVSESNEGVSSTTDAIAESADKAKDSLNGARNGFDQLVSVTKNSGSNTTSTPTTTSDTPNQIDSTLSKSVDSSSKLDSKMNNILATIKKIGGVLKNDFTKPINKVNFDNIKNNLTSVKDSLVNVASGTYASIGNLALSYGRTVATYMGESVRTVANIFSAVSGGTADFLSSRKDDIVNGINFVANNLSSALDVYRGIISKTSDIINTFILSPGIRSAVADTLNVFYQLGQGVFSVISIAINDVMNGINTVINTIAGPLSSALNATSVIIGNAMSLISTVVTDTVNIVVNMVNTYLKPTIDNIALGISSVIATMLNLYNTYVAPLISSLISLVQDLWDNHLKGMFEKAGEFIGKLSVAISELFKNVIAPYINYIANTIIPVVVPVLKYIAEQVSVVFGVIADVIGGVLDELSGLIDFITGVFTGDWKKAFKGLNEVVVGIFSQIEAILKAPFNLLITGLNTVIRGINMINIKVPDWVPGIGGNEFGFDIAEIPKLANGGVVTSMQKVIVGENGPEAVIPLSKSNVIDQLGKALAPYVGNSGNNGTTLVNNGIMIDTESKLSEFASIMQKKIAENDTLIAY